MKTVTIEMGRQVACDICNDDYTDRDDIGGGMFGSYAACPKCLEEFEKKGEKVTKRCPALMSFADWVRKVLRGTDNAKIEIHSGSTEDILEMMKIL